MASLRTTRAAATCSLSAAALITCVAVAAPAGAAQQRTTGDCTVGSVSGVSAHVKQTRVNIRLTPGVTGRFVAVAKPGSFFCQSATYTDAKGQLWRASPRIATTDGRFVGGYVFGPLTTRP